MRYEIGLCLLMTVGNAFATEPTAFMTDEHKTLIDSYVEAINKKDDKKLKSLLHPLSLACISEQNKDFFKNQFSMEFRHVVPLNHKVRVRHLVKGSQTIDEALVVSPLIPYPVTPTHSFQIDYESQPFNGTTIIRLMAQSNGKWAMVYGCPTAEAMTKFREKMSLEAEQDKRIGQLFADLQKNKPLLHEVENFLKQGKVLEAWKKYSSESGESLPVSKKVLERLSKE